MCSLDADKERVQDIEIFPHRNTKRSSKLTRPHIRTAPSILTYQESLLNKNIGLQEV